MSFYLKYYNKFLAKVVIILVFCCLLFIPFREVSAATEKDNISSSYITDCQSKFQNNQQYMDNYRDLYNAQVYDAQNKQIGNDPNTSDLLQAGCPPDINDITLAVMRIITILITLFGLMVLVSFIKGSINIMTSAGNKDKLKKGKGSIQAGVMGVIIVLVAYSLIVFIAVRLGLSGDPEKFSILNGPNLVFQFLFTY
ncbi:MAG: hypothetical protein WCJ19_03825 [bacterium]